MTLYFLMLRLVALKLVYCVILGISRGPGFPLFLVSLPGFGWVPSRLAEEMNRLVVPRALRKMLREIAGIRAAATPEDTPRVGSQ
jgi:hypothetical protein